MADNSTRAWPAINGEDSLHDRNGHHHYRKLSPNRPVMTRGGRIAKAKATKAYRTAAKDAVDGIRAMGIVTFFWKDNRRRDEDSAIASLKAAYDGIVDAGLIEDDNSRCLRREMPLFDIDRENSRVEITIKRLP